MSGHTESYTPKRIPNRIAIDLLQIAAYKNPKWPLEKLCSRLDWVLSSCALSPEEIQAAVDAVHAPKVGVVWENPNWEAEYQERLRREAEQAAAEERERIEARHFQGRPTVRVGAA